MAVTSSQTTCKTCRFSSRRRFWHFVTRLGASGRRCLESKSGKSWQCTTCLTVFVQRHRDILEGYIGKQSQFDEPVAWLHPREQQPTLTGVCPWTTNRKQREALKAVMTEVILDEKSKQLAVDWHRALQKVIAEALQADALDARKAAEE